MTLMTQLATASSIKLLGERSPSLAAGRGQCTRPRPSSCRRQGSYNVSHSAKEPAMSHVVSLRLKDLQYERLQHLALQLDRTPSETAVVLLEEGLRMREFPCIEFRDTAAGREAFL